MDFNWITPKQAAEEWGISGRRVQALCSNGQIPDVIRLGQAWLIPVGTPKPSDGRSRNGRKPTKNKTPHVIVIHGAPGSGKTTTAKLLHEKLRSPWFEFGWIPEFRNLNPHTEISWEQETEISFENLVLVVKNYVRHGFVNIIITDINFDHQILRLPEVLEGIEYRLFTLYANGDTLKTRILTRDNGNTFRDWESSLKTNALLSSRSFLQNETRICTENITTNEVVAKIMGELFHG